MIYTPNGDKKLKYNTPLISFIGSEYNYRDQNLIYTRKYSGGSYSITNPTNNFHNCEIINGYPHFQIPLKICLEEIDFFLSDENMYENDFFIRYGDTHPHKPIPKLSQIRNLMIENILTKMIGKNVASYYAIGDISVKSLKNFIDNNHDIKYNAEELFVKIANNSIEYNVSEMLSKNNEDIKNKINEFLKLLNLTERFYLTESSLYCNQKLYRYLKQNPKFFEDLKENGELKYSLQELMYIYTMIKNKNDVLINIIGSNQSEHILRVNNILLQENCLQSRFLSVGICKNAEERDINLWSRKIDDYIKINNLKIYNKNLSFQSFLKIMTIVNGNDIIIDYNNLDKYLNDIREFINLFEFVESLEDNYNVKESNDLIKMMSLVGYSLNRTVELGNQVNFYRYLKKIINEFIASYEKYENCEGLIKTFAIQCFDRLGYQNIMKTEELKNEISTKIRK